MYDPDVVTPVNATYGYQLMVQFGADERIENVAIGDGASWQVTPNKGASLLFIKPVDHAPRTNMTVITDRRSYLFELYADAPRHGGDQGISYVIRFTYPPDPVVVAAPPPPPPERRNRAYTYKGSRSLLPSLMFDDGQFTYFRWVEDGSTPAIFLLADDGSESLVDYSFRDGYQVVEQVASRFQLRDGKSVTTVINNGWRPPLPGPDAPLPAGSRHIPKHSDALRARQAENAANPTGQRLP
jgi:type IV secretion system protein VirB9